MLAKTHTALRSDTQTRKEVKIHFIGICGTGMGAVAELLKQAGHEVRGSDEHIYPPMSTQLARAGIPVAQGYGEQNLTWQPDVVVVGNICTRFHVEVVGAIKKDIRLTSFPAIIRELLLPGKTSFVVAGTHGKTTTSSLAAWMLRCAGRDPSFMIGGVPVNMERGAALGKGPHFVLEGDEYDCAFFDKRSKFIHYMPHVAILTSVEMDHADIFVDLAQVKAAFLTFVRLLPQDGALLVGASSSHAVECAKEARCQVERYGVADACPSDTEWIAEVTGVKPGGRTLFRVLHKGQPFGSFEMGLPGTYNLENAVGVIAALSKVGLQASEMELGLRRFLGVKRRQEVRGVAQGVTVVDDFAHHPTAIRETLRGLRGRFGSGRLFVVFEPRSATSRTALFQNEFAQALAAADEILIGAVHKPEKAPEGNRLDVEKLAVDIRKHGIAAKAFAKSDHILDYLTETVSAGDTVVVMSSGDFDNLHERLLQRLGDAMVPAKEADYAQVKNLLEQVKLPTTGVPDDLAELWVLKDGQKDGREQVVGCVALEIYDDTALLRSLAVRSSRRGEGLGWMLAEMALLRVRQRGLKRVCLLTEHATDFFAEKFGFRPVPREQLPLEVQLSWEYKHCCGKAVAMMHDLSS